MSHLRLLLLRRSRSRGADVGDSCGHCPSKLSSLTKVLLCVHDQW